MGCISVKELKEFLNKCDDSSTVCFEYHGADMEFEIGDTFEEIDLENSEIHNSSIRINFKL